MYVCQAHFTLYTLRTTSVSSEDKVLEMKRLEAVCSHVIRAEQIHSVHVVQLTVDVL